MQSQLKAIYKDNVDTIIGNMDFRIFLGGSESTTLKELNAALGKETIDLYNTADTRGGIALPMGQVTERRAMTSPPWTSCRCWTAASASCSCAA